MSAPGEWLPAGALGAEQRRLVEELVGLGIVSARFEMVGGQVIEVRRSEPGGASGPGAAAR